MTSWNMPPGCRVSDIPGWDAPDPTELQEKVWQLLEDAGMPEARIQAIDALIDEWQNLGGDPEPEYEREPEFPEPDYSEPDEEG